MVLYSWYRTIYNVAEIIPSVQISKTIISDHDLIQVNTNLEKTWKKAEINTHPEESLKSLNFFSEKINWKSLNEDLERVDWAVMSDSG